MWKVTPGDDFRAYFIYLPCFMVTPTCSLVVQYFNIITSYILFCFLDVHDGLKVCLVVNLLGAKEVPPPRREF